MQAGKASSVVVVGLLLACSAMACVTADGKPDWCHDKDCPHFQVVGKHLGYEERQYAASSWVATPVNDLKFELAVTKGFKQLFSYIDGDNEGDVKLNMTVPVTTRFLPLQGFRKSEENYTVAFYLPDDKQANPPKPANEKVHIVKVDAHNAYVAAWGGYAFESGILERAAQLASDLKRDNVPFIEDMFFFASYDLPQQVRHRHNEVWLLPATAAQESASAALAES